MSNHIMHVFPCVSMSYGHTGLAAVAKKHRVDVHALPVGQFALFVNNAFTACKLYAANNVILHYRHPLNHQLDYKALKLLPEFYDGQDIGYTKALRKVLETSYPHLFEEEEVEVEEKPKRKRQGKDF